MPLCCCCSPAHVWRGACCSREVAGRTVAGNQVTLLSRPLWIKHNLVLEVFISFHGGGVYLFYILYKTTIKQELSKTHIFPNQKASVMFFKSTFLANLAHMHAVVHTLVPTRAELHPPPPPTSHLLLLPLFVGCEGLSTLRFCSGGCVRPPEITGTAMMRGLLSAAHCFNTAQCGVCKPSGRRLTPENTR